MAMNPDGGAFRLYVPTQAVGANLVYFDLFNASGSGVTLLIPSVVPMISGATAVVGVLGVDLFLTRTTAIGTGGTAATLEGSSLTAATFSGMSNGQGALPAGISARLTPSGGATAGAVIAGRSVFTEETNSAAYQGNTIDFVRNFTTDNPSLRVAPGSGIRVVQGSVASVGNIGFDVVIQLLPTGA